MVTPPSSQLRFLNIAAAFVLVAIIITILNLAAGLFIPLVLAIVIWYILITISTYYERVAVAGVHISHGMALLLSILTCIALFVVLIETIYDNVQEFMIALPVYQEKLQSVLASVEAMPGMRQLELDALWNQIDLSAAATAVASGVNSLAGYTMTTLLYTIFLLLEYRIFDKKIDHLFPDPKKRQHVTEIMEKINTDTQLYIRIQTFVSILTAVCVYIVLLIFGVEFATFWALLTFVLNFIPTIGSIIASILPPLFALVQLESIPLVLVLAVLIGVIQFGIGNVLQPKMMGSSLNLSPLVILIGLAVWGTIWGIVGMFLCIPILVITNIIFAQFKSTRWIAVLCSGNGKVV